MTQVLSLQEIENIKFLLPVAAASAGFFITYLTGRTRGAILIPASIGGVITMLPVLSDPQALGFFGPIGLLVFVLLASIPSGLGAATGCLMGEFFRKKKLLNPRR